MNVTPMNLHKASARTINLKHGLFWITRLFLPLTLHQEASIKRLLMPPLNLLLQKCNSSSGVQKDS